MALVQPNSAPAPTVLHREFVIAGRDASRRRQTRTITGALMVATFALSLAGLAYWQRGVAIAERERAESAIWESTAILEIGEKMRCSSEVWDDLRRNISTTQTGDMQWAQVLIQHLKGNCDLITNVRKTIKEMGAVTTLGYIRADNESACGGARFSFTLPAKLHSRLLKTLSTATADRDSVALENDGIVRDHWARADSLSEFKQELLRWNEERILLQYPSDDCD